MTPLALTISPKWQKIIIFALLALLIFAGIMLYLSSRANRNYLITIGKLDVLVPQLKEKITTLTKGNEKLIEDNKKQAAELDKTAKERDTYKADNARLDAILAQQRKDLEFAIAQIEKQTPEETVLSLQGAFGKNEVSLVGAGVLFTLKGAKDVNSLYLTSQFTLKDKKALEAKILNFEKKIIPSLESDLDKVRASLAKSDQNLLNINTSLASVGIVIVEYDNALKYLNRSFSLARWKGRAEGAGLVSGVVFFLKVFKAI